MTSWDRQAGTTPELSREPPVVYIFCIGFCFDLGLGPLTLQHVGGRHLHQDYHIITHGLACERMLGIATVTIKPSAKRAFDNFDAGSSLRTELRSIIMLTMVHRTSKTRRPRRLTAWSQYSKHVGISQRSITIPAKESRNLCGWHVSVFAYLGAINGV